MFDGSHVDPLKKGIEQLIHHIAQTASSADMDAHLAAFYGLRLTKTFINSKNVIIPTFAPGAKGKGKSGGKGGTTPFFFGSRGSDADLEG